jgi:hypothetical protein
MFGFSRRPLPCFFPRIPRDHQQTPDNYLVLGFDKSIV